MTEQNLHQQKTIQKTRENQIKPKNFKVDAPAAKHEAPSRLQDYQ